MLMGSAPSLFWSSFTNSPMTQSSGGRQRRTIFKSSKTLKRASTHEADLNPVPRSKNGLSFPISISLQKEPDHDLAFLISSRLPESLPRQSPAARGRTLSQRPSCPPTFHNKDKYSVTYCAKVWFKLKSQKSMIRHRIWEPFLVLPFSVFATPDLSLPPLSSTNQPPPNWKVYRKTSNFGSFSSKRTFTSSFACPSPRYISSKDWVPFFLYVEVKSPLKESLAASKLPVLPARGVRTAPDYEGQHLSEPQLILSRQDDSPAASLGKSFAEPKRIPCEIEWISGGSSIHEDQSNEGTERGRNGSSNHNGYELNEDVGIGYAWTDIIRSSSESMALNNNAQNDASDNSENFEGGEELLPRFSQLSYRSRSSSRRRSRSRPRRVLGSDPLPRAEDEAQRCQETWYRSALLFGKIRTRALTPGFGLPSLSVQYQWRLTWKINPPSDPSGLARAHKVLRNIFNRNEEVLSMGLGLWLPSTGISQEEFQAGMSKEEVERRVGVLR